MPDQHELRQRVLSVVHLAGHEGVQKTLQRLRIDFYVPHDRRLVQEFVHACPTCQHNKTPTQRPAGLLQPLKVPTQV